MEKINRILKFFRKLYAITRGTFFTDCPRCFNYFYGFHPYKTQVKFDKHYRIVCHKCADEHGRLAKAV